jgi:hypothetical protein
MSRTLATLLLFSAMAWSQATVQLNGAVKVNGNANLGPQSTGVALTSITVSPSSATQGIGQSVTFSANGTFSDGTNQDITGSANWTVQSGTAASNSQNIFTCNQSGSVVVAATLAGIAGTATLTCQSLTISPTGTLTAYQAQAFAALFTAFGGVSPYTFSASGLPGWLSLSSTGCPVAQVNCNLSGTQNSLGSYSFNLTATDSISNTLTIPITVQVVPVATEDNRYCNSNGTSNVSGQFDGPANMIQQCVYDAIASTPATCIGPRCTVPDLYVCPSNQMLPDGITPVSGCLGGAPPYYNKIQTALNALTACGQKVHVYARNWSPGGVFTQNVYDEKLVIPGLTCGPNDPSGNKQWIWVETNEDTALPSPGTRITPAWAGQTSLPGLPNFPGPSTPGIYVPFINPSFATCSGSPACPAILAGGNGIVPSGWRFIGLELAWTQSHATAPGYFGALVNSGCSTNNCNPGAQYMIYDRMIVHACQDKTDLTCTNAAPNGFTLNNGNFQAVINSYLYGLKTIGDNHGFLGPQDESHGVSGGNIQGMCQDGPNKIVNNFMSVASQFFFFGGAVSDPPSSTCPDGAHPFDYEVRRNTMFRPTTWMVGTFNPNHNFTGGKFFDAFTGGGGATGANFPPSGSVCAIAAPPSGGTQATCTITVSAGKVSDVQITGSGSGYITANPGMIAYRYPNSGAACGTSPGCVAPLPTLTLNTTGGTIPSSHKILVSIVFVHAGDGYISDPNINSNDNIVYQAISTAGCTGGGCSITVTAPTLPPGFSGYAVYSCDSTGAGACAGTLQTASAACVNITGNCVIGTVGTGPASGNIPATVSEPNLYPETGIYIVKNNGEFKHGIRVLFEGNTATNVWTGQADEFGTCWLYRPTNDLEQDGKTQNCSQCEVLDVVSRYNVCKNASKGISFGMQQATRGGTLGKSGGRSSFHDIILELSGMWITATDQFGAGAGSALELTNNGQPGIQALHDIKFNHITTVHTEPANFSQKATNGSFALFLTALCGVPGKVNTTAVLNGITYENSIGGGGFRNISQKSSGCFQCQGSSTYCNSLNTLNSKLTNSGLDPVSGGLYTKNELTGIQLQNSGTCSVPVSSCTITGDGSGALCTPVLDKTGKLTAVALQYYGSGYTTAGVSFGGCNGGGDVLPTAVALIGGAGNPSPAGPWCVDHNLNVIAGWPGEDALLPDPSAQGDTTNACFAPTGGGTVDVTGWLDPHVGFANFTFDQTTGLPLTDDLHLTLSSSGHNAANGDNQGRDIANGGSTINDMGADVDLVLLYTGCTIQNGVMTCN